MGKNFGLLVQKHAHGVDVISRPEPIIQLERFKCCVKSNLCVPVIGTNGLFSEC